VASSGTPYYDADGITLYLGDCLEQTAWLAADVLVTDPPYGIGWMRNENASQSSKAHAGIKNDQDTAARDTVLALAAHMPAVVFGSFAAPFPARVKQTLVWQKPNDAGVVGSVTGFRRDIEAVFLVGDWPLRTVSSSSVLRSQLTHNGRPGSPSRRTGHPHSKPLDLMEQLIAACPPGVVADPFAGSGSTLLAARAQGRRAVGVEIDEAYCEVIASRLAQGDLFGETA
jgi:DNA modification methylase